MNSAPQTQDEKRRIRYHYDRYRISLVIFVLAAATLCLSLVAGGLRLVAIVFAGGGAFGAMVLYGRMRAYAGELREGTVLVYSGTVERKGERMTPLRFREYLLFVDGENHAVSAEFFQGVDRGDQVELHFCRHPRLLTSARLLRRQGQAASRALHSPVVVQNAGTPSLPALVMYAQPADLGEYDWQHDAFSQDSVPYQGTMSPGVGYNDPTVSVRLCLRCNFPLNPVTGVCEQCNPPGS